MNENGRKLLLIDNSNTRTKFLISHDGVIEDSPAVLLTADLSCESVRSLLVDKEYECVYVSSVVPSARPIFERSFDCPVHFINHYSSQKMQFDYPGVATLGADRVANALGAVALGAVPCVVIDAGTAVTFDVVVERDGVPTYIGGAIAPGLAAFTGYLHHKTAQLPSVPMVADVPVIGRNTVGAIQSGAFYGFCGMVQGLISKIAAEMSVTPRILLAGGDAVLLHNALDVDTELAPNLTFRGLAAVAGERF